MICSAARVPEHDAAVAVDGDDAVGDVREDREAALLLERDALVELGVRERGRRVRGERHERLDLLLAPACAARRAYTASTPCGAPSGPTSGTPR